MRKSVLHMGLCGVDDMYLAGLKVAAAINQRPGSPGVSATMMLFGKRLKLMESSTTTAKPYITPTRATHRRYWLDASRSAWRRDRLWSGTMRKTWFGDPSPPLRARFRAARSDKVCSSIGTTRRPPPHGPMLLEAATSKAVMCGCPSRVVAASPRWNTSGQCHQASFWKSSKA